MGRTKKAPKSATRNLDQLDRETQQRKDCPYRETEDGIMWDKPLKEGTVPTRLTNFTARIAGEVVRDDGVDTRRAIELKVKLADKEHCFEIPASQFSTMSWVMHHLGPRALLYPGYTATDHTRAAIQMLSPKIVKRTAYTHTGMRKIERTWVYLHAGGAIGPDGPVPDVGVELYGALQGLTLPAPPEGEELVAAIQASLGILEVGPDAVMVPLLAAAYRAPLGPFDQSLHLAGPTGVGKSELAALIQQHYGAEFDRTHLPASWSSTDNALEALAFTAKDVLLVIDDFCPTGTQYDVGHMHRKADRVIRAQGNRSGRQRLTSESALMPTRPPRGLILSSGEDVPRGQSLRARLLVIEVEPKDVDWAALTQSQKQASKGQLARALSGYICWVLGRYEMIQEQLPEKITTLRDQAAQSGQHKRTAVVVANLALALWHFLDFAEDAGAIQTEEHGRLRERFWNALIQTADRQGDLQAASEPTTRYLELLSSAIASGKAHLAAPKGEAPSRTDNIDYPAAWGWRKDTRISSSLQPVYTPAGTRVGWVIDDDIYLEPTAAFKVAQDMAGVGGDGLKIDEPTLRKRLKEKGLLASTDETRGRLLVRHTLEGQRREVLHLKTEALAPREPAQPAQPAQEPSSGDQGTGVRKDPSARVSKRKRKSPRTRRAHAVSTGP